MSQNITMTIKCTECTLIWKSILSFISFRNKIFSYKLICLKDLKNLMYLRRKLLQIIQLSSHWWMSRTMDLFVMNLDLIRVRRAIQVYWWLTMDLIKNLSTQIPSQVMGIRYFIILILIIIISMATLKFQDGVLSWFLKCFSFLKSI